MMHPSCRLAPASPEIGLGVFAAEPIPAGTIVWVLDDLDQVFPPPRFEALPRRTRALLERYAYRDARGNWVLCWDLARWVNHSCDANVLSTGWDFDVAVRDIAAGEEITNDYGLLNLERAFPCACGSPRCRGVVEPDDFEQLADACDRRVGEVLARIPRVPQPLWGWVRGRRRVLAAAQGSIPAPSVRNHRIPAPGPVAADGRAFRGR